jgi:hypothetical protein
MVGLLPVDLEYGHSAGAEAGSADHGDEDDGEAIDRHDDPPPAPIIVICTLLALAMDFNPFDGWG